MKKTVSIHQPSYFPWLGLLDKIESSDIFVLLDDVQLADRAYQHRNIFINSYTKEHLLTIPINKREYRNKYIKDITVANNIWQKKHLEFIKCNYKKHPFFDEIFPIIAPLYKKEYTYLLDILMESMNISLEIYSIKTKVVHSSELNYNHSLEKEDKILEILKYTNADIYISGTGASIYQKEENFLKNNIELEYQKFTHPQYAQYKNQNFIAGLSSLDIAFNLGLDGASNLLKGKI